MPTRRALFALPALLLPRAPRAEAALLAALAQGGVGLMRHALAPGGGDPPGFAVDDCSTQRNLSDAGRAQATALGARLREAGVVAGEVASSAWCRCQETARLLGLGPVRHHQALDSWFGRTPPEGAPEALRQLIAAWQGPGARLLVTHQVNITRTTGVFPASGELVVLLPEGGGFSLAGRIATPA
jgi:phosphohistidine phosphatase SixA